MEIETDAVRLGMIKAVGAEEFSTDYPQPMWGVFMPEYITASVGEHTVGTLSKAIHCRTSDVSLHSLVRGSRITRNKDGKSYVVRRFDPDESEDMTNLVLSA